MSEHLDDERPLTDDEARKIFGFTMAELARSKHNNGYRAPEVVAELERVSPTPVTITSPPEPPAKDLKQTILDTAETAGACFAYYDRKDDEELKRDDLLRAISEGIVTVQEISAAFDEAVRRSLGVAASRGPHE